MKKIALALLALFVLVSLAALLLQSPWGKGKAIALLNDSLRKSGMIVEVGEIRGSLPHQVELKGVTIHIDGLAITAESLEVRLSLLRLLQRELSFSLVRGDQITWREEREGGGEALEKT